MGRRGPGAGLRQAATTAEAVQWLHLFDALGCPRLPALLPHLSLRSLDVPALQQQCPPVAASLRSILAETRDDAATVLGRVNDVLANAYLDMERSVSPRVARAVFAMAGDGFPDDNDLRLMARWEQRLRALQDDFAASGLPARRREVLLAIVGHHLAAVDALQAATAGGDGALRWLAALLRWRRFASLGRALARILSAAEREQLVAYTRSDRRLIGESRDRCA